MISALTEFVYYGNCYEAACSAGVYGLVQKCVRFSLVMEEVFRFFT